MKTSDLARAVGGEFEGGADPDLSGIAPLDRAGASELALFASAKYADEAAVTKAGALVVSKELRERAPSGIPLIVVSDVHRCLPAILPIFHPPRVHEPGVHPTAVIGRGARLGRGVRLHAYAVIGENCVLGDGADIGAHCVLGRDCVVGEGVYLHPHVTLYDRTTIGARSVLHGGVRVGVDGFGYTPGATGLQKVPQVGTCRIGQDVEIGANTCIDRGSIGDTEIGDGCKIDNLVHIGHNVRIGAHTVIVAQVGISGSTRVGSRVTMGGQAGLAGHIRIGDGATIAGQAGVFGDVPAGATYSGYPARPHREAMRAQAALFRLPELLKQLRPKPRENRNDGAGEG